MAARYLRRHGDHRARAGRGLGKIQPLWRRVSLTAGTSGGGLGSVAPAAKPWPRGPRASTRTPGLSQTPQSLARVTLQHSPAGPSIQPSHPHSQSPSQSLLNTGSIEAQKTPKPKPKTSLSFAHLSAHLLVQGPHCRTDLSGFPRPEPPARKSATAPTQQLQKYTSWSEPALGVASNPSVPHPQTTSSQALKVNCLVHTASTRHTLAACFPGGHVQHPFPPASWRPLL